MKLIKMSELKPGMHLDLDYRELTPEELAEVYRLARESFTAADLQLFTEVLTDDTPAEDFLRELEETQRQFDEKAK
jgi:hypothetical protein